MHNPELVRVAYSGESSFNVMYQSPLSNSPGALAGLLLAFIHHTLLDKRIHLNDYKWFRWVSVLAPPISVWWAAMSPLLIGEGPPGRASAAILAAVERPVFSFFVALGLLGAMHNVESPLRTLFSWDGWQAPARLSFGVLLLHIPLNKSFVANRLVASQLTRQVAIFEWFGVAIISFACALPLAMLVEYPTQRLHRSIRSLLATTPKPEPPRTHAVPQNEKSDAD
ncbi:O-acyltransferase like protein [Phthorimaea operculella]|nr:O-acyltransferase like protein [Phthorimaea operculella]